MFKREGVILKHFYLILWIRKITKGLGCDTSKNVSIVFLEMLRKNFENIDLFENQTFISSVKHPELQQRRMVNHSPNGSSYAGRVFFMELEKLYSALTLL